MDIVTLLALAGILLTVSGMTTAVVLCYHDRMEYGRMQTAVFGGFLTLMFLTLAAYPQ